MTSTPRSPLAVALVGNPNTGKSTLFNALAGVRQRVGNYPGVTVEKKVGRLLVDALAIDLVDLPGTYSLAPRSPDEMVTVDVLLGRQADAQPIAGVLSIVDASNLERNLYLLSQVLELGLPTVVALNMVDVARTRGVAIDVAQLSQRLSVRVIEVQANQKLGVDELKAALIESLETAPHLPVSPFPQVFQDEVAALQKPLDALCLAENKPLVPRFLAERLLLDNSGYLLEAILDKAANPSQQAVVLSALESARARLAAAGLAVPAVEAMSRYQWVAQVLSGIVERPRERKKSRSDAIDRILTHRLWGTLLFALMMLGVFSAVFVAAAPLMQAIDSGVAALGQTVGNWLPEGALRSLIVDGAIAGVGGVLVFLPQIMILFLFIAILEDCGYMARAAYLMDKLMVRVGLSGKSFIPMLSSFACAVPGIMATRVIENRRDRLTTILVAPLMSCSARLPVYAILIGAFIPERSYLGGLLHLQGLTLLAMYLVGMVVAALVALVLKRTILRGPTPPFVMELPSYKWPAVSNVAHRVLERAWIFIYRAGTLILAVSIVIWAASYYPHNAAEVEAPFAGERAAVESRLAQAPAGSPEHAAAQAEREGLDHDVAAAFQRQSILGRLGRAIEPAVKPLGWDWRIGCAAIASFPAREVVMGALGVIYNLGEGLDVGDRESQNRLGDRLRAATWDGTDLPVYNIPVALSIMVFFALCAQCASTLVVIKRETNTWRWPLFTFVYMTALAYVGALLTYQLGMWIAGI